MSNVNELTLKKEIGKLESELDSLKHAFMVQGKIVDGFCRLRVREAS
jgi:hypothetical protein